MSDQQLGFVAWVNPLQFPAIDFPPNVEIKPPTSEAIIDYLKSPDSGDVDVLIQRYREITAVPQFLPIIPAEPNIMGKLIFPLKNAKGCYMLGNYLGTIALCGAVAEMVAILCFEMARFQLNGKQMDAESQANVFGSKFENLGQDRRVKVLLAYGIIGEDQREQYDTIRTIRKKYLHLFSQEHTNIAKDAVAIFVATTSLVADVIKAEFHNGILYINPLFAQYLIDKGFAQVPPPTA